jgi:hypothetical protein
MHGHRRIRVELDAESYEALHYFALLRGDPIGRAIARLLAIHATDLLEQFPPVRAHLLAWHQARAAQQKLASDNPVEGVPY